MSSEDTAAPKPAPAEQAPKKLLAQIKRRAARTPLWLRLVAATLLLVTLAVTITGVFAVELLRGYLVDRGGRGNALRVPVAPECALV